MEFLRSCNIVSTSHDNSRGHKQVLVVKPALYFMIQLECLSSILEVAKLHRAQRKDSALMLGPKVILHLEEPGLGSSGFTTIKASVDRHLLSVNLSSLLGNTCGAVGRGGTILCTF